MPLPGPGGYGGADVWCNDPQNFLTEIFTTGAHTYYMLRICLDVC